MKKYIYLTFAGLLAINTPALSKSVRSRVRTRTAAPAATPVSTPPASSPVQQNSIEADYLFNINSDFVSLNAAKALDSFFQDLNFSIPSYSVGTNPTVQIKNLKIKISPQNYKIFPTQGGVGFSSKNNIANVEVGTITVNETIHKEIGGVVADIQVFASCEGVKIKLSDSNSNISGEIIPVINSTLIAAAIKNPVIELGSPTLDISSAQCTGAQGFENEIKSTLEKTLNDKQLTREIINTQFIANLDSLTRGISYQWNSVQKILELPISENKKIELWMAPKQINQTSTGFQSTGTLKVVFPYPIQGAKQFPLQELTLPNTHSQNYIAVSDQAILALIQNYFTPQQWVFRQTANNFQGFATLLSSRFQQFMAWGDLMKWPKSSTFPLVATMNSLPTIAFTSANSVSIQSNVNIDMYGQAPGIELQPYMHFKMPLGATMQFNFDQDKLNFTIPSSNLSLKYVFDFDYCVKNYKTSDLSLSTYEDIYNFYILNGQGGCGTINSGVVSSSITSFLNSQTFSYPVPALNTVGGTVIRATSLKRLPEQKLMLLEFGN